MDLCKQPRLAGGHLSRRLLLMQPALSTRLPFEVFDRVGEVNAVAVDARLCQRLVKEVTSGANEGLTLGVFPVARLLPNQQAAGMGITKDRRPFGVPADTAHTPGS